MDIHKNCFSGVSEIMGVMSYECVCVCNIISCSVLIKHELELEHEYMNIAALLNGLLCLSVSVSGSGSDSANGISGSNPSQAKVHTLCTEKISVNR